MVAFQAGFLSPFAAATTKKQAENRNWARLAGTRTRRYKTGLHAGV
jgi:hypothetical protein